VPELVVTRLSVTESTVTTTSLVVVAAALLAGVIILMSWLPAAGVLLASDCVEAVADGGASKTYF